ncbi:MAG: DUF998 domain-containing protein [Candidatus Heimdallarchaeota archaeon]|nr:DUF998 domain-containing protein [Candidatus Heimdallarchaeota archaeon]
MFKDIFIPFTAIVGMIAFLGDFLITIIVGFFYPNYSHIKDTMSELGNRESPFRLVMTIWWIIFGCFFVLFALGFGFATDFTNRYIITLVVLISTFGLGAGIIAGYFPLDPRGAEESPSAKIHGIAAGIGFIGLAIVPGLSLGYFKDSSNPGIFICAIICQILSALFLVLFLLSENPKVPFSGLWQRLFLLSNYAFLFLLGILMIMTDSI